MEDRDITPYLTDWERDFFDGRGDLEPIPWPPADATPRVKVLVTVALALACWLPIVWGLYMLGWLPW